MKAGITRPSIKKVPIISSDALSVESIQLLETQKYLAELAKKMNEIIDSVNEWGK